jgi:hypothetical protein
MLVSYWKYDPGCLLSPGSRIRFFPIPDPGVKKALGPGCLSRIQIFLSRIQNR